jgi:CubicO group peptidase (beta-lactamase class C family)
MIMQSMEFDRRGLLGALALAGAGAATPAWAKTHQRGVSAQQPAIQAILDEWVRLKRVPGAVGMVAKGLDQAQYMTAGTIAFDSQTAMTPDTLFRAYSQTKPVTGMAAMMLIEDGKIGMDQNIADFIPAFANPKVMTDPDNSLASRPATAPITVRTLLTHTAGLGYTIISKGPLLKAYNDLGITPALVSRMQVPRFSGSPAAPSLEEFANRLGTLPLIADPGRKWSYSVALDLLGRVIEVASGMAFDEFLALRIFKPLGMTSTYFQVPATEIPRFTSNYFTLTGPPIPIDPGKESVYLDKAAFPFGGAGLVTSPRDWDRFALMLMGEGKLGRTRVMKPETARWGMSNLLHPDTEVGGFAKGQGFGAGGRVTINPSPNGEGIGTFGWGGAAGTNWGVDRVKGVRQSAWIQLMSPSGQNFGAEIIKAAYAS